MKQTAVEWVLDCLIEKHSDGSFVWNTRADLEALFKQAKEMEKQQIIDFANDLLARNNKNYIALPDLAEQYYNETFNK